MYALHKWLAGLRAVSSEFVSHSHLSATSHLVRSSKCKFLTDLFFEHFLAFIQAISKRHSRNMHTVTLQHIWNSLLLCTGSIIHDLALLLFYDMISTKQRGDHLSYHLLGITEKKLRDAWINFPLFGVICICFSFCRVFQVILPK
jgi:hypothetical protein